MPTSLQLIIGTTHPFADALAATLVRTYGQTAVLTTEDTSELSSLVVRHKIGCIYLLTDIFTGTTTEHPAAIWHRNTRQLLAVLNVARAARTVVFWPSSIAVFGSAAPTEQCPIDAPQQTESFFAISKRAGEQWCRQNHQEYGVDVRCLRFPVLIRPARATTILEQMPNALPDQRRPVLHVDDAVRATMELMYAPPEALRQRIYHVSGTSISVTELITEIRSHHAEAGLEVWNLPNHPGPESLDDSAARADWGWKPRYNLLHLVRSLLQSR